MRGMDNLRRRLDELKLTAHASRSRAASPPAPVVPGRLDELVGGRERPCGHLAFWHVETHFDHACRRHGLTLPRSVQDWQAQLLATPVAGLDPARTLVIDIETGGFSGTEVFLIGLVPLDLRPLRVVQFLARDYPEEEAILRGLAELGAQRDTWVTFNGKTFDEPFLRDRAARYRVPLKPPMVHVDVLHAARRRLRGQVSNCKLQTLEQHLLGWQRVGDVPGAEIPELFHHFMRTGNAAPIRPVLEHNQLDLISCTELLHRLA
jgi:uncharacterized protein YprB with RNaseH-like and TPR domain